MKKNKGTNMYCGTKEHVMENQKKKYSFNQKKAKTQEGTKVKTIHGQQSLMKTTRTKKILNNNKDTNL